MAERTDAQASQVLLADLARDQVVVEMVANDIVDEAADGTLTMRTSFLTGFTHEFMVEVKVFEVTKADE
jgi:hypothetical protein